MNYYLGIDIGASSGRHILGWLEDGSIKTKEIYRFKNKMDKVHKKLCWDIDYLFKEVVQGIKECQKINKIPVSLAIDTWAVDYALLDENKKRIGEVVAYRDSRTDDMDKEVSKIIGEDDLYIRTGIQKQKINTIYQLKAMQLKEENDFNKAKYFLMIPDYLNYLLTGVMCNEYTNASTTQLLSPITKDWDYDLINMLRYPKDMFQKIEKPGINIGTLKEEIAKEVGVKCNVVLAGSHDTASAVVAIPTGNEESLYISSGTWSLIGTELKEANCSLKSKEYNITNEGGYDYRFRFLKNVIGLWMIQCIAEEYNNKYSFGELCNMAKEASISSIVDVYDNAFLAPESMIKEVQNYCKSTNQEIPETPSEIARVIYRSLAKGYKKAIEEIEEVTGKEYKELLIVGGGSNAEFLNEITAEETGKIVYAGPDEATAIGNLLVQMISSKEIKNLKEGREKVKESFKVKVYKGEE